MERTRFQQGQSYTCSNYALSALEMIAVSFRVSPSKSHTSQTTLGAAVRDRTGKESYSMHYTQVSVQLHRGQCCSTFRASAVKYFSECTRINCDQGMPLLFYAPKELQATSRSPFGKPWDHPQEPKCTSKHSGRRNTEAWSLFTLTICVSADQRVQFW